jgi:biotin-dependent carboxylase-like uncharacterized protein
MIITFVTSGLRTTTQDLGRRGYTHLGIPVGGVLDAPAMRYANQLVGNPIDTPVLEITLSGPQLVCEQAGSIALTGANFGVHINGEKKSHNARIVLDAGDTLSFSKPHQGCRGYLAVEGDWQVKRWLGSTSALRIGSQELLPNAVWKAGDSLVTRARRVKPWSSPVLEPGPLSTHISVYKGPEFDWLTDEAKEALLSNPIRICEPSNRVGLRTDTTLTLQEKYRRTEMLSSGVMPGTVQLTSSGEAIILLADGQTIGGYPRVLQCSQSSLRSLGQLRAGDTFSLRLISQNGTAADLC